MNLRYNLFLLLIDTLMHLVIQGFEICLIYFLLSCCLIGKFLSIILESLEKKKQKVYLHHWYMNRLPSN